MVKGPNIYMEARMACLAKTPSKQDLTVEFCKGLHGQADKHTRRQDLAYWY
jgi:hypothetical protein